MSEVTILNKDCGFAVYPNTCVREGEKRGLDKDDLPPDDTNELFSRDQTGVCVEE